jgi:hypothetical protein
VHICSGFCLNGTERSDFLTGKDFFSLAEAQLPSTEGGVLITFSTVKVK